MKQEIVGEYLARCLAGAIDHSRVPGSSYGGLTSSDIAASLHAVQDRAGALLLQIKYLGLWGDLNALERILLIRVADIAQANGWRTKPHILGNLIAQALDEVIPAHKCPVCRGTRYIEATETTPMVICAGCAGTGNAPKPDIYEKTRAKRLNISESLFHRLYKPRFNEIIKTIQRLESSALKQVARYLKGA